MKKLFVFCVVFLSIGFADKGSCSCQSHKSPFVQVAKKATPGVVFIKIELDPQATGQYQDPFELFNEDFFKRFFGPDNNFQERPKAPQIARGTGFLVSKDGYVLTNNHVVQEAYKISVILNDGKEYDAELVGADLHTDLAVLKIDTTNAPYLNLGDSDALEVGEWVVAIGNPFELTASVTQGIVSAKGRQNLNISRLENFIQTDAAINPGNSGGPLLNLNGDVIGVNTAIVTRSGGYMGIGFAIPSNMAKNIMESLIENGTVARGFLGITPQDLTPDLREGFGLDEDTDGVIITQVEKGSPAEKADLKPGDLITQIDGKDVKTAAQLRNDIALMKPSQRVTLTVIRNKRTQHIRVILGAFKDTQTASLPALKKIGIDKVEELSQEAREQYGYVGKGVVVKSILPGSIAYKSNLRPGSIILAANNQKVKTPEELNEIVEKSLKDKKLLLLVRQGNVIKFINIKL